MEMLQYSHHRSGLSTLLQMGDKMTVETVATVYCKDQPPLQELQECKFLCKATVQRFSLHSLHQRLLFLSDTIWPIILELGTTWHRMVNQVMFTFSLIKDQVNLVYGTTGFSVLASSHHLASLTTLPLLLKEPFGPFM